MTKENLISRIENILDQFTKEELGNKLSQFSMLSLKEIILNEIRNFKEDPKDKDLKEVK